MKPRIAKYLFNFVLQDDFSNFGTFSRIDFWLSLMKKLRHDQIILQNLYLDIFSLMILILA
jgi:hypothetical protein